MAITFTWSIVQLDCFPTLAGKTDVVQLVHWKVTGTDSTHTASTAGCTHIPYAEEGTTFTDYAALTETEVLAWVKAELDKPAPVRPVREGEAPRQRGGATSAEYEAVVASMLAEAAARDTPAVPWAR